MLIQIGDFWILLSEIVAVRPHTEATAEIWLRSHAEPFISPLTAHQVMQAIRAGQGV